MRPPRSLPVLAAAIVALSAAAALASPAPPVPLEQRVADAKLIVVARLTTQPVHCGDEYEIAVEETLKGEVGAPVMRVRAPWSFTGCVVIPNQPPPKALEAGARRAIFFLGDERDGARDATQVVTLDPDEGMPAWFWIGVYPRFRASFGPEAVRTLVRMDDASTDASAAAELWMRGLESDNPLLVDALLERFQAVAGEAAPAGGSSGGFGGLLVQRARRDADAWPADDTRRSSRAQILDAVLARCGDPLPPLRECALRCAEVAWKAAGETDRAAFESAIAQARESSRSDDSGVRWASMRLLVTTADPAAMLAVVDALRRRDDDRLALGHAVDLAVEMAGSRGAARNDVIGVLVQLLDDLPDGGGSWMDALRRITGEELDDPDQWRAWWASRK